jgi:hypothetical protein
VAAVALSGDWAAFASQKVQGALRLAGTVQTTGFNRPASVPLATKLTQDIGQFAPTYCLIGVGAIACVVLARSRSQPRRLLAAWAGSAFVFLAYAMAFGTIEEQMFYYLVVPALVVTTVATEWLWRTTRLRGRHHRAVVAATCVAAALFVAAATSAYVQVHTTTDDGYDRLVAYLDANVPARSTIAISAATNTADFVLDRFSAQKWDTVAQLVRNRAQYALVSTKAVSQGYSAADPTMVPWLRLHATPIWSYNGASVGELILYRLSPAPTVPG